MKLGAAAIRAVVGPLFIGHGTQKLFGWFGGHGIEGTGGYFESLGLKPGRRHAAAAGLAEALGGLLIALGFLTPVGASMVSGAMITAIRKAHAQNGPWVTNGGYEYNLTLLAAMFALTDDGPGALSLDEPLFGDRFRGMRWALLQLGTATAASFLVDVAPLNQADQGPAEGEAGPGDPASNGRAHAEDAAAAMAAG